MASDPIEENEPRGRAVLEELDRAECLSLLQTQRVGRLALVADGEVLIFPVNYAVSEDGVVVMRGAESAHFVNELSTRASFEVDHFEPDGSSGWSVVVSGMAFDVTDGLDARSRKLREVEVDPWPADRYSRCLAIVPERITGRRLRTPAGS
jgi:nitroimidazol reductase NimA-like FMN-containing flavoprotein (pyridoxamine 5'-phosphate oxidase superfamily)